MGPVFVSGPSMHPSEDQALELMFYAADTLGYLRPDRLPDIIIDPDMEALGQFTPRFVSEIKLKYWREGNRFDQCVLVHELAHHIQSHNGATMGGVYEGINHLEVEALTAQCMWLKSVGEDPRRLISRETIFRLTGDASFARLGWLEPSCSSSSTSGQVGSLRAFG